MDIPMRKKIKMSHLSAPGSSATFSHLRIDQNTIAVKKELIAYTSPSTALYQNESVNVPASAPTTPAAITPHICVLVNAFELLGCTIFRAKCVMVQNKNKIVNPLARALITFTAFAAVAPLSPNKTIKILPSKTNKGAPGGCGICTLKQLLTNSPQSQKLPLASLVIIKTVHANKHTSHPVIRLIFLKFIPVLVF